MVAVGVDGCKGEWVAVAIGDGDPCAARLKSIDELGSAFPDAEVVAIDIPVGLVDVGDREADRAVKALLGARRHSLFMTPMRAALGAASHAEGSALSVASTGAGISRQAYGLRGKIFEVEQWLSRAPCGVFEVHPELCFTEMRGGDPPVASKKSWHGMVERRAALEAVGITLDAIDVAVGSGVAVDDMLDAAAAAWTASRLLAGKARSVPSVPTQFADDRPIAIWV